MNYDLPLSYAAPVLFRLCNKLYIYDKSQNLVSIKLILRDSPMGHPVSYFVQFGLAGTKLTITENNTTPPNNNTYPYSKTFTTLYTPGTKLLHTILIDDNGTPEIVVGTGDTRDNITEVWPFSLANGPIISSPNDNQIIIYSRTVINSRPV